MSKLIPTIGIECHVQLKTETKLFARVNNDAREAPPNTTVSPICFGLPGVLPYLNEGAIELAIKAGIALNAEIAAFSKFDRKHYFYPDLPKGYQITQYDQPIIGEGYVEIVEDGKTLKIGIERAHLEEDAGKSTHPAKADYSLVDLNRAGTPLLEIVSKPDIHSAQAAKAYARELYLIMKYAGVSDVDLYHGHMRFDVNISMAPRGSLGTRAEIKNLNSFRAVERAATYEITRQTKILNSGATVVQETRGWDETKGQTFAQRSKEEAHDYRYFPDPDLPPITIPPDAIEDVRKKMPSMPGKFRQALNKLGIAANVIEMLVDDPKNAQILQDDGTSDHKDRVRFMAQLISGPIQSLKNQKSDTSKISIKDLSQIYELRQQDKISSNSVDAILEHLAKRGGKVHEIAESEGFLQVSDSGEIEKIVAQVLEDNPKAVTDVKAGEDRAVGFLVGQVMKESRGQANPQMAKQIIEEKLNLSK